VRRHRIITVTALSLALASIGAACGDDDGSDVRSFGNCRGSGSASAFASGSGAATQSASASGGRGIRVGRIGLGQRHLSIRIGERVRQRLRIRRRVGQRHR
jgi:hypothetical protein